MGNSMISNSNPISMTSREIADLTNKQHAHVMRDIRAMIERIKADPSVDWHCESITYVDAQGKQREQYRLDRDTTLTLITGYDPIPRMKIIKRWQELETTVSMISQSPQEQALSLAQTAIQAANAFGFTGNAGLLSADHAVRTITGVSALALLGQTKLIANDKGMTYTPTELGQLLDPKCSARKINMLLAEAGLQNRSSNSWEPTELGNEHCEILDTGKAHYTGVPIKQVKWFKSVLDIITNDNE